MLGYIKPLLLASCILLTPGFAVIPQAQSSFTSTNSIATNSYAPLTPEQSERYTMAMQQAIDKAQQKVNEAGQFATRRDLSPTWSSKIQLQQAITMLEVKKTLMNNFKGTESLRSQAVREKLLNLLNRENLSTSDLADLQNLVLQEKEKIRSMDQQQAKQNQQEQQDQSDGQ